MIKHAWSVLCNKTIIDRDSNNISLDVIERIILKDRSTPNSAPPADAQSKKDLPENVPGIIVPISLTLVSLWYRENISEPGRGQGRLKILSPSGKEIAKAEIDIDLIKHSRSRSLCQFDGLPIPKNESGIFYFIVEIFEDSAFKEVAKIPLEASIDWAFIGKSGVIVPA